MSCTFTVPIERIRTISSDEERMQVLPSLPTAKSFREAAGTAFVLPLCPGFVCSHCGCAQGAAPGAGASPCPAHRELFLALNYFWIYICSNVLCEQHCWGNVVSKISPCSGCTPDRQGQHCRAVPQGHHWGVSDTLKLYKSCLHLLPLTYLIFLSNVLELFSNSKFTSRTVMPRIWIEHVYNIF